MTMTDDRTKQKAIEAAADIYGFFLLISKAADMKDQKLTVIGQMDTVAVVKKVGKVDIISVGPAKEDKKDDKKSDKK
ncbi:hypothetical protein BT93_K1758 [Corymbia citriodora subsp. variegata]|nr:hypothetical protein BT93_K1758 [Corymbia citriodora subsp. variegata]